MNKILNTSLFNRSGNILCGIQNIRQINILFNFLSQKKYWKKIRKQLKYNSEVDMRIYLASVFITKKITHFIKFERIPQIQNQPYKIEVRNSRVTKSSYANDVTLRVTNSKTLLELFFRNSTS